MLFKIWEARQTQIPKGGRGAGYSCSTIATTTDRQNVNNKIPPKLIVAWQLLASEVILRLIHGSIIKPKYFSITWIKMEWHIFWMDGMARWKQMRVPGTMKYKYILKSQNGAVAAVCCLLSCDCLNCVYNKTFDRASDAIILHDCGSTHRSAVIITECSRTLPQRERGP